MGWSYGGYAAARAAQRDAARWRCTIAGAGVYDLPMMRDYNQDYIGSFGDNYLAKGASSLDDMSPARNTDGEWAPTMKVHGVCEPRDPIGPERNKMARLKGRGQPKG